MLLSAVSFLVVAQSIFEIPEGLMNNPVVTLAKDVQGNYTKSLQLVMSLSEIQTGKFPMYKWKV